jgi:hypothetical protein
VFGLHQGENAGQIADFKQQTGVTFPILQDETSTLNKVAYPPGVGYPYPRDVVIGKDLTIRSIRNSFDVDEMDALVQQLLNE